MLWLDAVCCQRVCYDARTSCRCVRVGGSAVAGGALTHVGAQISHLYGSSSDACGDARSDKPCICPAWGPVRAAVQVLRPFGSDPDACGARAFSDSGFGFHPSEAVFRSRMDGIRTRNIAGMRVDAHREGAGRPLG